MNKWPILAGDIGGSKSRLALYDSGQHLCRETTYSNAEFKDFQEILNDFLHPKLPVPARACLGVAGQVHNNCVTLTNLDWHIDGKQIRDSTGIPDVLLVNDLVATAAGLCQLTPEKRLTLNSGKQQPDGTVAVIAPGTGLGQAYVITQQGTSHPLPSEGGHSSFAPRNRQQLELLAFMLQHEKHVSVEKVCSGMAIPYLFTFISQTIPPPPWLTEKIKRASDPTPVIIQAASVTVNGNRATCKTAVRTVQLFMDILAAESANLALKVLATGGVYIGGGLPPRIVDFFEPTRFMQIFCRGTFRNLLADIPVHLLLDPKTALPGARTIAMLRR
jgi:glucokinase